MVKKSTYKSCDDSPTRWLIDPYLRSYERIMLDFIIPFFRLRQKDSLQFSQFHDTSVRLHPWNFNMEPEMAACILEIPALESIIFRFRFHLPNFFGWDSLLHSEPEIITFRRVTTTDIFTNAEIMVRHWGKMASKWSVVDPLLNSHFFLGG